MVSSRKTTYSKRMSQVGQRWGVLNWQDTEQGPDIEQIEARRPMNKEMDAVYLLSPEPHIVDCLLADLERRRYRKSYIIWTSCEDPQILISPGLEPLKFCIS